MTETILVGVAWPYTNGHLHLGHLAGCYVAADIFSRYHRLMGDRVLMVSGSDQHGTPITLRAEEEGVNPQEVVDRFRKGQLHAWKHLGIEFDLFTTTGTTNHRDVTHDVWTTLQEKGFIYRDTMRLPFCLTDSRFLPDRFVVGTCPFCGNLAARGDQCDSCGKPMNPLELGDLRCRLCGDPPEIRDSEHDFLRLSAFRDKLLEWVSAKSHWRANVLNFTRSYLQEGLHDRAVSRDINWGISLPSGDEDKRVYVWFEAVIGYLSASKEWAQNKGDPDAWREFWENPESKSYYFMGKDNIPFHTIIWPAMLMAYGGLNLPYDVPANEYMNMLGGKFSKSEKRGVWIPDYLERYAPDPLRYYIAANMPETGDTEFTWDEFVRRNNDELVATYGNLVNRVLTMVYRNFEEKVPTPAELDDLDRDLLARAESAFEEVGAQLTKCGFRAALSSVMGLAQSANKYLDVKAPWKMLKENRQSAGTSLWVTMVAISALKTLMFPFLPFSSEKLHSMLGFDGDARNSGWSLQTPEPGQPLPEPEPLFTKFDLALVEEEALRMEQPTT